MAIVLVSGPAGVNEIYTRWELFCIHIIEEQWVWW
jgi:hypothetical protein